MDVKGTKKTRGIGIALMILCAFCLCMGQFIWKRYDGILPLLIGFIIYGLGALSMLVAYRFGSLSVLQPINSLSYVLSAIVGVAFFQETLPTIHIFGIILIVVGVIFLAQGSE